VENNLTRDELIELVDLILKGSGSLEEQDRHLGIIERNVLDPNVFDLIYWPRRNGLGDNPSAAEIVDKALSYKPIT